MVAFVLFTLHDWQTSVTMGRAYYYRLHHPPRSVQKALLCSTILNSDAHKDRQHPDWGTLRPASDRVSSIRAFSTRYEVGLHAVFGPNRRTYHMECRITRC